MPVTRTYLCDDCGYEFKKFHMDRNEPAPDCEMCAQVTHSIPGRFNITGVKAKAIDMVQKMVEEDYGMTNMRDNGREGDIAAMGPSQVQTAEAEQLTRQMMEAQPQLAPEQAAMVNTFWKTSMTPGSQPQSQGGLNISPEAQRDMLLQQGAVAAQAASGMGADPIGLIHEAGKKGMARTNLEILNPPSTRSLAL